MGAKDLCSNHSLSIIIPVYNSEQTLEELVKRINHTFNHVNCQLILVNDNSSDHSWRKIEDLSKFNSKVFGINLSKNFGQHSATLCGISYASGSWIATIDDDLEQSPASLLEIYQYALNSDYDVIYGIRSNSSHPLIRQFASSIGRFLFRHLITDFSCNVSSTRLIRGSIAKEILSFHAPFSFIDGYLNWVTNNVTHYEIPNYLRNIGKSRYTFKSLLRVTASIFLGFSDKLLKGVIYIGIMLSMAGVISAIVLILMRVFLVITLPGFSSIIVSICIFSGVQLFILGVLGMYLSRLTLISSNKPQFLVRQITQGFND